MENSYRKNNGISEILLNLRHRTRKEKIEVRPSERLIQIYRIITSTSNFEIQVLKFSYPVMGKTINISVIEILYKFTYH